MWRPSTAQNQPGFDNGGVAAIGAPVTVKVFEPKKLAVETGFTSPAAACLQPRSARAVVGIDPRSNVVEAQDPRVLNVVSVVSDSMDSAAAVWPSSLKASVFNRT